MRHRRSLPRFPGARFRNGHLRGPLAARLGGLPPPWKGFHRSAIRSRSTRRRCGSSANAPSICWSGRLERDSPRCSEHRRPRCGSAWPARPEQPEAFEAILEGLQRDVLPFTSRDSHPRFFSFSPLSSTWPGALGDLIASACNLYAGSWMESAGPEPGRARGARLVQGVDRARLLRDPRGVGQSLVDGEHTRELGPGEFFGELAALDWGAVSRTRGSRR